MKARIYLFRGQAYRLVPLVTLAFILLLTGCVAPASPVAPSVTQPAMSAPIAPTIVVIGNGDTRVKANIVQLSLGVEVVDDTVVEANRTATETLDRVLETLASQRVAGRDIKSIAFNIFAERYYPDYERDDPGTVPLFPDANEAIRYRVTHQIHVLIRDIESVSEVIAAVVEVGGPSVYIYSTDFLYDNPASLEPAAREKAILDARGKAEEIAVILGVELGPAIGITEIVQNSGMLWDNQYAPPIWPGNLQFYKQLQVTYSTLPTSTSLESTPVLTNTVPITDGGLITKTN